MLHRIRVEGIEAYCFDLIVDKETSQYAYFLSVAGYQTAVKGILANFLKGESLEISGRVVSANPAGGVTEATPQEVEVTFDRLEGDAATTLEGFLLATRGGGLGER